MQYNFTVVTNKNAHIKLRIHNMNNYLDIILSNIDVISSKI